MRLTVFVITRGRPDLLRQCVQSVLPQIGPEMELRVLVNGPDHATQKWLSSQDHPALHWRVQGEEHRTICRNRAFVESQGEIIYFLDDDVVLRSGGLARLMDRFADDPQLVVLGGPNLTPPQSTWAQRLFGAVMTSPVAAPMVRVRYGEGPTSFHGVTEKELVLCNLAVRRSAIPSWLRFPPHYLGNEENVFMYHCKQQGFGMGFDPDCSVYHARRSSLRGFLHQVFYYGAGRAQQTCAAPRSLHPLFLAPPALCAGLVGLAVFFPLGLWALLPYAMVASAGALSSRECRALGMGGVLAVGGLTPLAHIAYGLGFWWGGLGALFGLHKAQHVRPPVVPSPKSLGVS